MVVARSVATRRGGGAHFVVAGDPTHRGPMPADTFFDDLSSSADAAIDSASDADDWFARLAVGEVTSQQTDSPGAAHLAVGAAALAFDDDLLRASRPRRRRGGHARWLGLALVTTTTAVIVALVTTHLRPATHGTPRRDTQGSHVKPARPATPTIRRRTAPAAPRRRHAATRAPSSRRRAVHQSAHASPPAPTATAPATAAPASQPAAPEHVAPLATPPVPRAPAGRPPRSPTAPAPGLAYLGGGQ